ncbi:MAG: hypothetical protein KatS3mg115_0146 [Candidatus Poribacteria bacterium]|nr:MAG: hypothetical protein KatS3mg115_0146 [Candidatus Poribacteria bacterium]
MAAESRPPRERNGQNDKEKETFEGERLFDLQEAARIIGKSDAALRMQIRRGSIRAVKRPMEDGSGRYKYLVPESEIRRERERLASREAARRRYLQEATTVASEFASRETYQLARPSARYSDLSRERAFFSELFDEIADLTDRMDRLEHAFERQSEDTRALIRALEQQMELLRTLVTALLDEQSKKDKPSDD